MNDVEKQEESDQLSFLIQKKKKILKEDLKNEILGLLRKNAFVDLYQTKFELIKLYYSMET